MAAPLDGAIPPALEIRDKYIIRFAALSVADGSAVSGVTVSDVTVQLDPLSALEIKIEQGEYVLVPGPSEG